MLVAERSTAGAEQSKTIPLPHLSGRIPALDGVRAIAILLVFVFHFFQHRPMPAGKFAATAFRMSYLGQSGVDLFFVLSGFLITGILLDARGKNNALRDFYMRRILRIFPLYYGFLFVLYIVLPAVQLAPKVSWNEQWWFWTYFQNVDATFAKSFPQGPGHFWSLAVEEHFYLFWPFIVLKCSHRRLVQVLIGLIAGSIAARAILVALGYPVFYFTLCRVDALAFGSVLALLARHHSTTEWLQRWSHRGVFYLLPVLAVSYAVLSGSGSGAVQVVKFTIVGLFFAAVLSWVLYAHPESRLKQILGGKQLGAIGKYSYGMYVLHPSIFLIIQTRFDFLPVVLALPLAAAVTFMAAWCSWQIWEKPFLRLKDRFPGSAQQSYKAA